MSKHKSQPNISNDCTDELSPIFIKVIILETCQVIALRQFVTKVL